MTRLERFALVALGAVVIGHTYQLLQLISSNNSLVDAVKSYNDIAYQALVDSEFIDIVEDLD